jgi:hypothetical protein
MRQVAEARCCQILITNRCCYDCANCSELTGHMHPSKKFDMPLANIEAALQTLVDLPGHVGIFGGEPTLHPQFGEVLALLRKYVWVKARRELWTSGAMWEKWKTDIEDTFYPELISFNDHSKPEECFHQPNNIAACDVFNGGVTGNAGEDAQLMWKCIDNCWIQNRWSPIINPLGAFFCETAGARALVMGGPAGLPVVPGWWRQPLSTWTYQMGLLCSRCSTCLPMPMKANSYQGFDDVSPTTQEMFIQAKSPKAQRGAIKLADLDSIRQFYKGHTFTPNPEYQMRGSFLDFPDWTPWKYRPAMKNTPDGSERKIDEVVKEQRHDPRGE